MKLPVVNEPGEASVESLVRATKKARATLAAAVADQDQLDGATAFTNASRPHSRLSNYAAEVEAADPSQMRSVMEQIRCHCEAKRTRCLAIESTVTWPAELEREVEAAGFRPARKILLRLQRFMTPQQMDRDIQIIPARASYRELRAFYDAASQSSTPQEYADTMIDRLDEPQLELFLGRLDGRAVGTAGVISLGHIGVIDAPCVIPQFSGRGVESALIAHTIGHCQRAQFQHVLLECAPPCESIKFYESIGFVKIAETTEYVRMTS